MLRALLLSLLTAQALATPITVTVRDAQGTPLAGAVVALEQAGLPRVAKPASRAQVAQRDRQFLPRLLVVQAGTEVVFPNQDKVRHHVYSYAKAKTFELKLYLNDVAPAVRFDDAGVVPIGCNIHDRMSAHIVVVNTPIFAVSDAQGHVQLARQPGAGVLRWWHPKAGDELRSQALGAEAEQLIVIP